MEEDNVVERLRILLIDLVGGPSQSKPGLPTEGTGKWFLEEVDQLDSLGIPTGTATFALLDLFIPKALAGEELIDADREEVAAEWFAEGALPFVVGTFDRALCNAILLEVDEDTILIFNASGRHITGTTFDRTIASNDLLLPRRQPSACGGDGLLDQRDLAVLQWGTSSARHRAAGTFAGGEVTGKRCLEDRPVDEEIFDLNQTRYAL